MGLVCVGLVCVRLVCGTCVCETCMWDLCVGLVCEMCLVLCQLEVRRLEGDLLVKLEESADMWSNWRCVWAFILIIIRGGDGCIQIQ